jgi:hypothetical protein
MRYYFLVILFIIKIFESNIFAGVYLNEIPGNTVIPIQQHDIKLIKEITKVEDNVVEAIFTFENASEKEINIQMGFPFNKDKEPLLKHKVGGKVGTIEDNFVVKVEGKELLITKENITKNVKARIGSEYDFMYTWTITFKPEERKIVECTYNVQWATDVTYPSGSSFTYITKTGALWKDTIGEAEFYIKLDSYISKLLKQKRIELAIKPNGYKIIDYQTIKWHFTNWEPLEDISITIWGR